MSTSSIRVTEGSGPYIWTDQRSVSSVNREAQYVLPAEPALPTFTAVAGAISTATGTSHLMQIMAGSSVYVRVLDVQVWQDAAAGSTTLTYLSLVRIGTSAGTGGTSVTPRAFDTGDTAAATAMTLPSSEGTEGAFLFQAPILLTATTPSTYQWRWTASERGKPIIIPAGTTNGLVVRNTAGVATATVSIAVTWTETAWL